MRVIHRKAAYAHQAVQSSRQLGTIARSHFAVTLRQVPIRTLLRLINADVHRAVHRLQTKFSLFELGGRKHRVAIVLFVAANLPQLAFRDMGRVHQAVIALDQLLPQILFHLLSHDRALWVPQDETLAVLFLNRKQVEFASEPAMITLLGFFTLLQPGIKFLLRKECRAIDALHLRPFGVALPVSSCQ